MAKILVGDCVSLKSGLTGTVKFKGEVGFAQGEWYGIALATPDGTHDGYISKEKRRYFTTKEKHGMFITCDKINNKMEQQLSRPSKKRKTDRTEKTLPSQSNSDRKLLRREIWLNYLHEKEDRFYSKDIFHQHFNAEKNCGNRRGFNSPRVLDLREWIVKQTFGKYRKRKLNEVKVYLEEEERRLLEDKEKLSDIFWKRITVLVESKSPNEDMIHVNRIYELVDGRVGQCLYKGLTKFAKGNWIGIALSEGEGKHDGSVYGKRYFRAREGRGIFVRPWKVKGEVLPKVDKAGHAVKRSLVHEEAINIKNQLLMESKESDQAEESYDCDRSSQELEVQDDWKPADYKLEPCHDLGTKPKLLYLEKELRKNYGIAADHKMTITEFEEWCKSGKNEKAIEEIMAWKRAQFDVDNLFETNRYDISVPVSKLHKNDGEKAPRKLGPTAIGTAKGYKPAHFRDTSNIRYDISYTLKQLNKTKGQQADKKLGPQDIGKMKSFEPANFGTSTEGIRYDISYTKSELDKNAGEKVEPKLGPKQIGRNKDYEVPEYDIEVSNVRYDLFYLISKLKEGQGISPKLGPRDIGINKDFKRPKYELNTEEVRRDLYHSMKDLKKNEHCRAPKRQRVRSIGFAKGFNPFKSAWEDTDEEILGAHLYYAKRKGRESEKSIRKLGPLDIGRADNFTPYRVPTRSKVNEKEKQFVAMGKSYTSSKKKHIKPRGHSTDNFNPRDASLSENCPADPSKLPSLSTKGEDLQCNWLWGMSRQPVRNSIRTEYKPQSEDDSNRESKRREGREVVLASNSEKIELSEDWESDSDVHEFNVKSLSAESKRTNELLSVATRKKDIRGKDASSQRSITGYPKRWNSDHGTRSLVAYDEQKPTKRGSLISRRRFKFPWGIFCNPTVT